MKNFKGIVIFFVVIQSLFATSSVLAAVTYTYIGNTLLGLENTQPIPDDRVVATFTFDFSEVPVFADIGINDILQWSISTKAISLSEATGFLQPDFPQSLFTIRQSKITAWDFVASSLGGAVPQQHISLSNPRRGGCQFGGCADYANIQGPTYYEGTNIPGHWLQVANVSLPGAIWLLVSGLSGLGFSRRLFRK